MWPTPGHGEKREVGTDLDYIGVNSPMSRSPARVLRLSLPRPDAQRPSMRIGRPLHSLDADRFAAAVAGAVPLRSEASVGLSTRIAEYQRPKQCSSEEKSQEQHSCDIAGGKKEPAPGQEVRNGVKEA